MILVQDFHDLFRLGAFSESGEAAQVEINHGQLAPVGFERIVGFATHNQFGELW